MEYHITHHPKMILDCDTENLLTGLKVATLANFRGDRPAKCVIPEVTAPGREKIREQGYRGRPKQSSYILFCDE
jgi:hypothetical protein